MKPSVSEDTTSRPPEPCFFLDRTIDNPIIATGLREMGCIVKRHSSLFVHNVDDAVWIEDVAKKGWVIITNDKKIRTRSLEIKSVVVNNACMFCLTNGNMTSTTVVDILKSSMNQIKKYVQKNKPPYIVRLRRGDGRIQRITLNTLTLPKY